MPLIQPLQLVKPLQEKAIEVTTKTNLVYKPQTYSTFILTIAAFRYSFIMQLPQILKEFKIHSDDEEYLFDWIVSEALAKTLGLIAGVKLSNHYRHDIYKCVYDQVGHLAEQTIMQQFNTHQLQFLTGQMVKIIVAGDNLIISRGVINAGF